MENIVHDKKKLTILGIIVAILFGICYYFFYWIKTPAYSLGLIREAYKAHDVEKFEKHVDLDTILPKLVDDVLVAYDISNKQSIYDYTNVVMAGFVQALKPAMVNGLKKEIITNVKGVEQKDKSVASKNEVINASTVVTDLSKFTINRMSFASLNEKQDVKNIKTVSQDGNSAIVSADVFDKKVKKYYTVRLKMSKLEDSTWKITGVSNAIDLFTEVDKNRIAVLDKYDEFQKDKINKIIWIAHTDGTPTLINNIFFNTYKFDIFTQFMNISGKDVHKVRLYVAVCSRNNPEICKKSKIIGLKKMEADESRSGTISIELNPFVPGEDALSKMDKSDFAYKTEIISVSFEDGTVLERPRNINDVPDDFIK